jgi:hypothetical protein
MAYGVNENVIEFLTNQQTMTVTFSQGRFIGKVKKLAERYPDEVEIVAENEDGSIVAHMPVSYLALSNRKKELTDEERIAMTERLNRARENIQKH